MAKRSRTDVKYAIDLLWTHQIRRENRHLHKKVQQLQENIDRYTEEQQELRVVAQTAETSAKSAWETIKSTSSTAQNLQTRHAQNTTLVQATSKQVNDFSYRLESLQKDWQGTTTDLDRRLSQNEANLRQVRTQCDETVASLKTRFEETNRKIETKSDQDSLESLHLRLQALEQQFSEQVAATATPSHVSESVEPAEVRSIDRPEESDIPRDDDATHGDALVEEEQMLTMRNVVMRDSTSAESLDLDANVSIPTYALHSYRQPSVRDSLKPIEPTSSTDAQLRAQILALKQGRYHSHDRYLAEVQSLLNRTPKEQERFLLENFVRGLYSAAERHQCLQWLQLNGWQWATVVAFPFAKPPSAPVPTTNANPDHNDREDSQLSSKVASGDAPLGHHRISVSAEASRNKPQQAIQPRRSTRISASQHPFRIGQQQSHNDSPQTETKARQSQLFQSNDKCNWGTRRSLLERPVPAASSVSKGPSTSRARSRCKPASAQQQSPLSAQPRLEAETQRLMVDRTQLTPERNTGGFRATSESSRSRVVHEKRKCPSDWLTTESERDDSTTSDQVELPTNPSPELEPRKKRRTRHHHNRQTVVPPPEIPILSTSE